MMKDKLEEDTLKGIELVRKLNEKFKELIEKEPRANDWRFVYTSLATFFNGSLTEIEANLRISNPDKAVPDLLELFISATNTKGHEAHKVLVGNIVKEANEKKGAIH